MIAGNSRVNLLKAVEKIVAAKRRGGSVVVVTGSGPNIHEGVTTLIAELMHKGVIDGVITSSAVVAHEMAGTLDRVKRVCAQDYPDLMIPGSLLPRGGLFEITLLSGEQVSHCRGSGAVVGPLRSHRRSAGQRNPQSRGQHGVAHGPPYRAPGPRSGANCS